MAESTSTECPRCGVANSAESRFCSACGQSLVAAQREDVEPPGRPASSMSSGTWPSAAGYGREESTNEAITLPIASGWLRLAAWLVDGVIASVIGFIGGLVFGVLELATRIESLGFLFLALIVAYPVILTIMVANRGQSPGKIIVGIKIVRQDGRRLGYGLAILREWIGKFISALILYLGFIWILFDEKRQGWHGKFADTVVVRVP